MMRAAVYYNNRDIRVEEMPVPKISSCELLVKVMACGICGSDVMEWYRIGRAPLVLGHEITGVIEKVGEEVKNYRKGDRVFVSHHVPCNTCYYCLKGSYTVCDTLRKTTIEPGGFAEYIRIPEINVQYGVYTLPPELSFEAGTLIEPLACVVRGQRKAHLKLGQSVLVIGSGISGLLHIQLAHASGASSIMATDINDFRLSSAEQFGADYTVRANENISERLRQVNNGRLADVVIVCTSAVEALKQAFQTVDRNGIILVFAPAEPDITIPLHLYDVFFNGITITASYGASPLDIATAIELLRSRRIEATKMITHRLPLAETGLGFELVSKAQNSIKVIIELHR